MKAALAYNDNICNSKVNHLKEKYYIWIAVAGNTLGQEARTFNMRMGVAVSYYCLSLA